MTDWTRVCVSPHDSVETVINVIDKGGLRIALVVNGEGLLLGTVTDGDIRRAFIKHFDPSDQVQKIMNSNPRTVHEGVSWAHVRELMDKYGLIQIPVLNTAGKVVSLETLQPLKQAPKHDNPVFLMAGGFGKRLRPLTQNCPKPLLKVGGKPILETIIESFRELGFWNFYISLHYLPDQIKDYFGDGSSLGVKLQYVMEDEPYGTGGALGLLPKEQISLPLILMNGDILTKVNFEQLIQFHLEQGNQTTMCVKEYGFQVPYGVVRSKGTEVIEVVEKPVQKFFVNAGIYVLNPEIVKSVQASTYMETPNLINSLIRNKQKVSMFPVYEYWLDIGQKKDYERAQVGIAGSEE